MNGRRQLRVKIKGIPVHFGQAKDFLGKSFEIATSRVPPHGQRRRNAALALKILESGMQGGGCSVDPYES
jgi:hypothetical protein